MKKLTKEDRKEIVGGQLTGLRFNEDDKGDLTITRVIRRDK